MQMRLHASLRTYVVAYVYILLCTERERARERDAQTDGRIHRQTERVTHTCVTAHLGQHHFAVFLEYLRPVHRAHARRDRHITVTCQGRASTYRCTYRPGMLDYYCVAWQETGGTEMISLEILNDRLDCRPQMLLLLAHASIISEAGKQQLLRCTGVRALSLACLLARRRHAPAGHSTVPTTPSFGSIDPHPACACMRSARNLGFVLAHGRTFVARLAQPGARGGAQDKDTHAPSNMSLSAAASAAGSSTFLRASATYSSLRRITSSIDGPVGAASSPMAGREFARML